MGNKYILLGEREKQKGKLFSKGCEIVKVKSRRGNDKINKQAFCLGNKVTMNAAIIAARKHRGSLNRKHRKVGQSFRTEKKRK